MGSPRPTTSVRTMTSVSLAAARNGFMLMVESGRIDKYTHSLDWERAVYDTIMLDNAVKAAKNWAKKRKNDTLIIVVPDHTHPVSIIGTFDDSRPGSRLRDKLGIYNEAGFPNYPAPDADGYPSTVDVSKRIAFSFGAFPDYCATGKPYLDGENKPTGISADGDGGIAPCLPASCLFSSALVCVYLRFNSVNKNASDCTVRGVAFIPARMNAKS